MARPSTPVLDRLADKFLVGDGCWEWTACRSESGYGRFKDQSGKQLYAHRAVYEAMVGPIPAGLQLDHLCRNRGCVRPDHLEPVTGRTNTLRGHTLAAANAQKTHCPRDHGYAGENLYVAPSGVRHCRACERARKGRAI